MGIRSIQPHVLASWIRTGNSGLKLSDRYSNSSCLIVDVRDHDYQGGKIYGSVHMPFNEWEGETQRKNDEMIKYLIDNHIQNIVFHCTYSAVRGPTVAKGFANAIKNCHDKQEALSSIKVHVLEGGWAKWSVLYGKDPLMSTSI